MVEIGLVEEVGTALQTAGVGTLGTSLFLNSLPETTGTFAVGIFETGGLAPGRTMGTSYLTYERARIQVQCRASASTLARKKLNHVFIELEETYNTTLSGTTYLRIEAVQSPFLLTRDAGGRTVFAANFDCWRRPTTST